MRAVRSSRGKPRQDHLGRLVGIVAGIGLGHGENGTSRTRVRAIATVVLSHVSPGESCIWATLVDRLESGSGAGCKKSQGQAALEPGTVAREDIGHKGSQRRAVLLWAWGLRCARMALPAG